jgi:hypothetical protein
MLVAVPKPRVAVPEPAADPTNHENASQLLHALRPYRSEVPVKTVTLPWASLDKAAGRWAAAVESEASIASLCAASSKLLRKVRVPCHVRDSIAVDTWYYEKHTLALAHRNDAAATKLCALHVAMDYAAEQCADKVDNVAAFAVERSVYVAVTPSPSAGSPEAVEQAFREALAVFFQVHAAGSTSPDDDLADEVAQRRTAKLGRWFNKFLAPRDMPDLPTPIIAGPSTPAAPPGKLGDGTELPIDMRAYRAAGAWKALLRAYNDVDDVCVVLAPKGFERTPAEVKLWLWMRDGLPSVVPKPVANPAVVARRALDLSTTLMLRAVDAVEDVDGGFRLTFPPTESAPRGGTVVADDEKNPFAFATLAVAEQASRALRRAVTWGPAGVCAPITV